MCNLQIYSPTGERKVENSLWKLTCRITLRMSSLTGSVKDWHVPWKHQRTMPPLENIVKRSNITWRISSSFFFMIHDFLINSIICACSVTYSQNAPRVHFHAGSSLFPRDIRARVLLLLFTRSVFNRKLSSEKLIKYFQKCFLMFWLLGL